MCWHLSSPGVLGPLESLANLAVAIRGDGFAEGDPSSWN